MSERSPGRRTGRRGAPPAASIAALAIAILTVVVVAGLIVGACGKGSSQSLTSLGSPSPGGSSASASPSPTGASPSVTSSSPGPSPTATGPTPSPSPTDPTAAFEAYLAKVKPIRNRFHALALRLHDITWKQAHNVADETWPPAGRKIERLLPRIDVMRADWDAVVPPQGLGRAHRAYLRCMRKYQLAYDRIAYCFKNKLDWSADSANGKRIKHLWDQAENSFDVFKHDVMVQSRELDVKVPWKWK